MSINRSFRSQLISRASTVAAISLAFASLIAAGGCESSDPTPTSTLGAAGNSPGVKCSPDEGVAPMEGASCAASPDDYTPRESGSSTDTWPACISDKNEYVPFSMNISSLARVAAFEQIRELLDIGGTGIPTPQDFLDARVIYSQEQGIESRVSRREDEHYPPAPAACRDLPPEEQQKYPDRCVGPVKIRPILNAAFEGGIAGESPVENAARIEGALLWFFYVSIYKEATSAAQNSVDVDSMWAKYTGGEPREGGIGLSAYVKPRSQEAHDRIWDGLLAVRCWRDLDNPTGAAMDLALRDRARAQLDRALLRGMALILRQRLETSKCSAAWESAKILGEILDREATARDKTNAAILRAEIQKPSSADVDVAAATEALDAIFPCP
jgi:hypothetical protein